MRQSGRLLALAIIGSATVITTISILSFTATQFVGSGDKLLLDVDVKPNNVKLRATVNSHEQALRPDETVASSPKAKVKRTGK